MGNECCLVSEGSEHQDDFIQAAPVVQKRKQVIYNEFIPPDNSVAKIVPRHNALARKTDTTQLGLNLYRSEDFNQLIAPDVYKYNETGDTYSGEFKQGLRHGLGKIVYSDGSVYEGDWVMDRQDGQGRYVSTEGEWYEGTWVKGQRNGKGKSKALDGTEYDGNWEKDVPHGIGLEVCADGSFYVGDFEYGVREGNGTLTMEGGKMVYEGQFSNYEYEGVGKNFDKASTNP